MSIISLFQKNRIGPIVFFGYVKIFGGYFQLCWGYVRLFEDYVQLFDQSDLCRQLGLFM